MTDDDFYFCRFIKEELCYLTYYDFCQNAALIKLFFERLGDNAKIFYKFYVYANIHMDEFHKNLIWNFLNSTENESYRDLIDNIKTYRVK